MNQNISDTRSTASSWDAYWSGDQASSAYSSSGVNHEDISAYWATLFSELAKQKRFGTMLDIATGNGALPEIALTEFANSPLTISAVDISPAAIDNIAQRFPSIIGVVADAKELPFEENTFDVVTSQFGIEYAGIDAIAPSMNFVAPGGTLALMLHIENGKISQECTSNRDALQSLVESQFVSLAANMFKHGFEAVAGADRLHYDKAAEQLSKSLPDVESIIETYGEAVAGGLVLKLYNDVGSIHSRMPHYQANDILPWLDQMQTEIHSYIERMQSMLDASLSQVQFDELSDKLVANSFSLEDHGALFDKDTSLPMAWVLRAQKTL